MSIPGRSKKIIPHPSLRPQNLEKAVVTILKKRDYSFLFDDSDSSALSHAAIHQIRAWSCHGACETQAAM
jgi:hypothetical protein